jgi:hypothetical protein
MVNKILKSYKSNGIFFGIKKIVNKVFPEKANSYVVYKNLLTGKNGLEIGGPSAIFKNRNLIPVYQIINSLDNCTFTSETIWEGKINELKPIEYEKKKFIISNLYWILQNWKVFPLRNMISYYRHML